MFLAGMTPKDETTTVELAKGDPAISTQDSMAKRLKGYEEQYSQDFLEYRPNYAFTTTQKIYGSMNAISDTSDDPERTMMFLNEMIGNTDFANLIFYGVEGVSYERNENGQIKRDTDAWNMTTWSLPGFITAEPDTSLPVNMVEMYEAFDKELVYADNMGFAFDEEPVMTELAAIRQVTNEYYRRSDRRSCRSRDRAAQVPGCSEQRWSGNCPRRGAEPAGCMAHRSGQVIFDTISNLTFHYVGLDYFWGEGTGTCSFLPKIKNTSPSVPPT